MQALANKRSFDRRSIETVNSKRLSAAKLGLIVGTFLGVFHACWALLVASGYAQPILDWIFWLHFLNNPLRVDPFGASRAFGLIALTSVIGYIYGAGFALIWNWFHRG